jgi:hypothetical protein
MPPSLQKNVKNRFVFIFFLLAKGIFLFLSFSGYEELKKPPCQSKKFKKRIDFLHFLAGKGVS